MEGFLIFKVLEAVCEAGPALLLNSYTMALSLLTEEKAPEVVPLTWVGFIVSVVTFSYAIISLHIESVGVTSWKKSLFAFVFFMLDILASVITFSLLLGYFGAKMLSTVFGILILCTIVDARHKL